MLAKEHPCFTAPEDKAIKLWRYMDFTKFVSLLETESIFLSRSDKFDDPYEGSTTQLTKMTRPARKELTLQPEGLSPRYVLKDITVESLNSIAKFNEWMRSWTYVNCWHMNPYESAAMWKLYARTDEAVAIQSTYTRLRAALPDDAYVGVVKYIDYDTDSIPEDNVFWPYVHKRKSFEHEKELRIVKQRAPLRPDRNEYDYDAKPVPGISLKVELRDLIEAVYVSPTAPGWFFEIVQSVTKRYGLPFRVNQSDLAKQPVF